MQSTNKIYVNSSTELSLNDRFTMMQSDIARPVVELRRNVRSNNRSASTSRSAAAAAAPPPSISKSIAFRNRNLAQLLDLNQKIQAALRLKRRSVRRSVPPRQTMSDRLRNRIAMKRIMNTMRVGPSGRIRRANSLTNIRTMRADLVVGGHGLTRSNSSTDITARLGRRRIPIGMVNLPRRRLNRTNFSTLRRSSSRQNLNRLNTQQHLPQLRRFNSQTNLKRSISKQSLRGGEQIVQNKMKRRLSRSSSRINNRRNSMSNAQQNRPIVRNRNRSQIRNNAPRGRGGGGGIGGGNNVIRGRVFKRRLSMAGNQNNGQNMRANQRQGRSRSRVGRVQNNNNNVNRSASRGRINRQGNINKNNLQNRSRRNRNNNTTVQRRSRSRQRKGSGSARNGPAKTKEELDKELDQYMVNTKPSELDSLLGNI